MPVIPYEQLLHREAQDFAADRLRAMPPGMVIGAGQSGSGKVTTLLALALRAQAAGQKVVLLSDHPTEYAPFEPLPPGWNITVVEPSTAAWSAALDNIPDGDLVVVAPLHLGNARIVASAARTRWIFAAVETALAGLDLSYVLCGMGVGYADFAQCVRSVWSILLLPALCDHCGVTTPLSAGEAELLAPGHTLGPVKREAGCPACGQKGVDGWIGLLDILLVPPEEQAAVTAALVKGIDFKLADELHVSAQDEARRFLEKGLIGLNTYREAIQRHPLLRVQHALQVVQAQADKLAQSLWLDLEVLTAVADKTAAGVLVVDEAGKVRFSNALGRGSIDDSGELVIDAESLHAKTPRVMRQLAEALHQRCSPCRGPPALRYHTPRQVRPTSS